MVEKWSDSSVDELPPWSDCMLLHGARQQAIYPEKWYVHGMVLGR